MNIINSTRESVSQQRKELWSWNKNQNVALEQMKAATMVLNMLDYAIASIHTKLFFKDNLFKARAKILKPRPLLGQNHAHFHRF